MSGIQNKVFERVLNMAQIFQIGVLDKGSNLLWTCRWNEAGRESSISYQVIQNPMDQSLKLRLRYRVLPDTVDNGKVLDYTIPLATSMSYKRKLWYWFVCPLVINGRPCKRRVRNIYFLPSSSYFGCKNCRDLMTRSLSPQAQRTLRQTELLSAKEGARNGGTAGGNGNRAGAGQSRDQDFIPDLRLGWRPTPSRRICENCGCLSEGKHCCNCGVELGTVSRMNFFEVLGAPPSAGLEELNAAFKTRIKQYHPDRVAHLGEKLRKVAEVEIKIINEAYETLRHPDKREAHLREIAAWKD